MDTAFVLRPVSPVFGAEVLGVDLRHELAEPLAAGLREAWHRHALLLFRDQFLSAAEQDRVASAFGEVTLEGPLGDRLFISNVVAEGLVPNGELDFHMDHSFAEHPLRGLMLYAYEVPPEGAGGETMFANVKLAYDLLPRDLRERIASLEIVHKTPAVDPPVRGTKSMVYTHPVTGEKLLYCSPRHFDSIPGMDQSEAQALVDELAGYINRPANIYKHAWRTGDLIVWDNIRLQHARTDFDPKYRRHLRRAQIKARSTS